MGLVCTGPRVLWAEFVMGRDIPEPNIRNRISIANSTLILQF